MYIIVYYIFKIFFLFNKIVKLIFDYKFIKNFNFNIYLLIDR